MNKPTLNPNPNPDPNPDPNANPNPNQVSGLGVTQHKRKEKAGPKKVRPALTLGSDPKMKKT